MVIICCLNIGLRVTRKVPSNGGILKQKRIITATWKTERPFQSTYINISLLGLLKIMSVFVNSFSSKLLYSFWGFIKVLSRKAILFFTCLPNLQNPFATVGWSQEGLFSPLPWPSLPPPPPPPMHTQVNGYIVLVTPTLQASENSYLFVLQSCFSVWYQDVWRTQNTACRPQRREG